MVWTYRQRMRDLGLRLPVLVVTARASIGERVTGTDPRRR